MIDEIKRQCFGNKMSEINQTTEQNQPTNNQQQTAKQQTINKTNQHQLTKPNFNVKSKALFKKEAT